MAFLDRIRDLARPDYSRYLPFRTAGTRVGRVRRDFASNLEGFAGVFRVGADGVDLADRLEGFAERTRAVDGALRTLAARGLVPHWRDEPYPVATSFAAPPLFVMERAAVPLFGVRAYGVHVNGFVRTKADLEMWIGRRSPTRPVEPGKLDQIVAGGQPAGLGLRDNLIKECAEEASIPSGLARRAVPVGAITYCAERPEGLRDDVIFVYDLELAEDFRPANTDGEIAEFHRWPIERVAAIARDTRDFKFNCSLVVIDFLLRHGRIEPDHPDYVDLVDGLHS